MARKVGFGVQDAFCLSLEVSLRKPITGYFASGRFFYSLERSLLGGGFFGILNHNFLAEPRQCVYKYKSSNDQNQYKFLFKVKIGIENKLQLQVSNG